MGKLTGTHWNSGGSDSELRAAIDRIIDGDSLYPQWQKDELLNLLKSHLTAERAAIKAELPNEKHHTESDRNIAYREGFNDCLALVTQVIDGREGV